MNRYTSGIGKTELSKVLVFYFVTHVSTKLPLQKEWPLGTVLSTNCSFSSSKVSTNQRCIIVDGTDRSDLWSKQGWIQIKKDDLAEISVLF